jgi:hypothetical protein
MVCTTFGWYIPYYHWYNRIYAMVFIMLVFIMLCNLLYTGLTGMPCLMKVPSMYSTMESGDGNLSWTNTFLCSLERKRNVGVTSMPGQGSGMCNQLRLETQNQAQTWLILGSSRTHTCAYSDALHWPCVLPRVD